MTLLPLILPTAVAAIAAPKGADFDAPVWKDVATVYYDTASDPACTMHGSYFKGRFIGAADEIVGKRMNCRLRRKFTLKAAPVEARLQAIGDERAEFRINSQFVLACGYSYLQIADNRTAFADVLKAVRAGENLIEIDYASPRSCRGGVLLELFVRLADGSTVRIDSDERFSSSVGDGPWKEATLSPPPPAAPRTTRFTYRNYEHPQRCFGGGPQKAAVTAGETVNLNYRLSGPAPEGKFSVRVSLMADGKTRWNEEIALDQRNVRRGPKGEWALDFEIAAPLYFNSGDFDIKVESNSIWCPQGGMGGRLTLNRREVIAGLEHSPVIEMKTLGNGPAVHLDGKPFPLFWGGVVAGLRPDRVPRHGDMPLTAITCHNYYWQWHPKLGVYDFSVFDTVAERYRRANPDARFIWDLTVYPPPDFATRFPEEMSADETGDITPVARFSWCYASRKALDELKETIAKAIAYLESSPYANRIIGYRINSGTTIEWLGWDARRGHAKDFSKPNQAAFKAFASERYPELRDPHVPDLFERQALDRPMGLLWDRQKHLNAVAFMDYNSWIVAQDVLACCRQAKSTLRTLERQKLVGTYYGYTFYLNGDGDAAWRAHFALKTLLRKNDGAIDFLMSPNSYGQRNLGDTNGDMKPYATLAMNGIMSILEDDTRTHNRVFPFWMDYNQTHTPEQTEAVLRRNFSIALCRNAAPYCYALNTGVDVDSPECARVGRDLLPVIRATQAAAVERHAEVALVASEKTITTLPAFGRSLPTGRKIQEYGPHGEVRIRDERLSVLNGEIANAVQTKWARAGVPFDQLLAEDLADHPGDYRLYVFLNALTFDEEFLRAVARLRDRGATMLWIYAPGFLNNASLDDMKRLTGIGFVRSPTPLSAAVTLGEDGRKMGMAAAKMPDMFIPVAPDAVLGRYENGQPGLTRHHQGKCTAFFSGPWQMDLAFIRWVIREAGVHVYSETGDPLEANDALVTLHARAPGRKTIRLPRRVPLVADVFNRRVIAEDTDEFTFEAALHSSHLFYFGPDAGKLLRALK